MKKKFIIGLFFVITIAAFSKLMAQSAPPPPPPPTPVPIDGGLSLVIAGCVGYGVKKIHDKRKAQN